MKLAKFEGTNGPQWGRVESGGLVALAEGARGEAQARAWLASGEVAPATGAPVALERVQLLPPLLPGATLYCVGLNYKSHVEETGRDLPPQPSLFIRNTASVVGSGQPLRRPVVSTHFDFEGEVAVVIGREGHNIPRERAMQHVAGYTGFNDGSLRDYQKHSVTAGKNFEASGACGPWIAGAAGLDNAAAMALQTRLNGVVVQSSNLGLLIYPIDQIVAYVSSFTTLRTGDIIATGTPAGVGARRDPPLWMKAGDLVEVDVAGVGVLRNPVVDA